MICATRSGSAAGDRPSPRPRTSSREPWRSAAGRNSRGDLRGEPPEVDRLARGSPSRRRRASRGRAGRRSASAAARPARASSRTNSARASGLGVLVLEQLDEAAEREDRRAQLVRGVGDELLAGAVEPRQPALHLVEGPRELADLVAWSRSGSASRSRPRRPARRRRSSRRSRREMRPRGPEAGQRARRRSRSRPRSGSGAGSARRCRRPRRAGWRAPRPSAVSPSRRTAATAVSPTRSPATARPPELAAPAARRRRPRRRSALDRGRLDLGVGDHERRARGRRRPRDRRAASPGVSVCCATARTSVAARACEAPCCSARGEPRALLGAGRSSRRSFSAVRLDSSCGTT